MAQEPIPLLTGRAASDALDRLRRGRICGECDHFAWVDEDGSGSCPSKPSVGCCDAACLFFRGAPKGSPESQEPNHES